MYSLWSVYGEDEERAIIPKAVLKQIRVEDISDNIEIEVCESKDSSVISRGCLCNSCHNYAVGQVYMQMSWLLFVSWGKFCTWILLLYFQDC